MNGRSSKASMVQKLKERFRDETFGVIMAAAEEVFARPGLHGAHMAEIAARAGVAVGTVYNHFNDREALLGALLDARRKELVARLDRNLAAVAGQRFAEQLDALVRGLLEHFEAHRPFLSILNQGEL